MGGSLLPLRGTREHRRLYACPCGVTDLEKSSGTFAGGDVCIIDDSNAIDQF